MMTAVSDYLDTLPGMHNANGLGLTFDLSINPMGRVTGSLPVCILGSMEYLPVWHDETMKQTACSLRAKEEG